MELPEGLGEALQISGLNQQVIVIGQDAPSVGSGRSLMARGQHGFFALRHACWVLADDRGVFVAGSADEIDVTDPKIPMWWRVNWLMSPPPIFDNLGALLRREFAVVVH